MPGCAAKGQDVVLLIDINGEGCVVDDGREAAVLGLTNVNSTFDREHGEPGKRVVPFRAPAVGGERVEIWVEAGANDLFGVRQQQRQAAAKRSSHCEIRSSSPCNTISRFFTS